MPRCNGCQQNFPRDQLVSQQVLKGHNGRRKNGYLLMCRSCAKETTESNQVVVIITLVFTIIFCGALFLIRGH